MTGLYYLARPWQNKPQAVYLGCSMSDVIIGLGWSSASAGAATTADVSYGEYNSTGAGANAAARAAFSSQLTSAQAANYTIANVLGSWDPCVITNVCNAVDFPMATANFIGTQLNATSASFGWNMCWPLSITYTLKRSNNGGTFSTIDNFTGSTTSYNYTSTDGAMPTGVNRYILQMTNGGTTLTSTDTITISNQPTITTNIATIPAFTQTIGSPSFTQIFSVSGANLTANIIATAPTNFEVSNNGTTGWGSAATITQSGGAVTGASVYVRLNAGSNGAYSGNVFLSTTGGTNVNVAVSGTTSSIPAYTATLLQEWPLTSNNNDNSITRAIGINASTPIFNKLFSSNGTTLATIPAYSTIYGQAFGTTSNGDGTWTAVGGTLNRTYYEQFTISGATGYTLRLDSILLNAAFYNTSSNTKLAIVYSKNGFTSPADSTDITVGGTLNGSALGATAFGGFTNFIALANQTGGPTNSYRLPLNGSSGVSLASGQTLTIRLYFACGSTGTPRYAMLKGVQLKGSVTAPAPTVSSFTPTGQVAIGSVVITGANFSGVTAVSFGGVAATSFIVNSATQITAVVANGTASGSVSVTTASGTATLAGFTFQTPTTYYNVSGADVTNVNNWGTNTDGTGTQPSNFTSNLQTFKIANSGAIMSGAWTVSGTNSKIVVANGSAVFNQTQNITGTIDVENNGDLEIKTATNPTLGTLSSGSTVGYSAVGIAQTIVAANYDNLVLTGTGTRSFPSGSIVGIASQFSTNSYTTAGTGSVISFNGTSPQTIPPFTYDSIIVNNSNGCITQGGGSSVVVNKGSNILQNLTIDAGDTWVMVGSNGVSFTVASAKILTVNGTLDNQSTGFATWGALSSVSSGSTAANADSARFVINNGGVYKINAAVPNSYYIGVGTFNAGSEIRVLQGSPRIPVYVGGNVTWSSTGVGTLIQQATTSIGGTLTVNAGQLNNGAGGTGRTLNIYGNLQIQGGEYEPAGFGNSASQVVTVFGNISVTSGNLYTTLSTIGGSAIINAYRNVTNTGGNIGNGATNVIGGNITLLGSSAQIVSSAFTNGVNLVVNNTAGVTVNNSLSVATLTLTNGVVNMGDNTMAVSGSLTRTTGWVRGNLQKRIATGSSIAATFEVGDATNYLPINLTFANVFTAGDLVAGFSSPITAVSNYATAPISSSAYVNKYWSLVNVNTLAFTNYNATLNYVSSDLIGGATAGSLIAAAYNTSWASYATTAGSNSNTINTLTSIGNIVLANPCITVTPSVSIVANTTPICSGSASTFTATGIDAGTSPIYTWKRNGVTVGSGTTITFPIGVLVTGDTITCVLTANNNCQTIGVVTSNKIGITVNTSPSVGAITNYKLGGAISSKSMCAIGDTLYLANYTATGVWTSSNSTNASVTTLPYGNGKISYVLAKAAGTATINYNATATSGCVSSSSVAVTVAPITVPAAITGASAVCVGSTIALSTTATGGVWSSTAPSYASVNASGLVTGRSEGVLSIRYSISNSAGCSIFSSKNITVNALPVTPSIGYKAPFSNPQGGAPTGGFCVGKIFGVLGTPAGGVWSSTGIISVTSSVGIATINAAGAGSLTYTFTNTNGCVNSRTMTGTGFACAARGNVTNNNNKDQNLKSNDFILFPNPASTFITINVEKLIGTGTIIVTDLYGKTVKSQPLSMGNNTVDIVNLSKGFYLISTITNEGKTTKKLVVE